MSNAGYSKRSPTIRSWPWLEAAIALVVGLVMFLINKKDLAQVTWTIGAFQSFGRLAYSRLLASELEPIRKMAEVVDLNATSDLDNIRNLSRLYTNITEPEFNEVKELVVQNAIARLQKLANEKTSDDLASGEYYAWLLPRIEQVGRGEEIWAVSMMLDSEWDDSPSEQRFLESNINAAKRGAVVNRIFVVSEQAIPGLRENKGIRAHLVRTRGGGLNGFIVHREFLQLRDPGLLRQLGEGLIAFGARVAVIDATSSEGLIRGRVTMNPTEIAALRRMFDALRSHANELANEVKL
ncbi:hypothetical protein AB0F52_01385 [Amycolatopsis sp. NPDC024027]|uniref:hypothetical protein n=1 Tax=Amycolatopsis sp. NPDC024027 TaxID=3154327 RepID=UPI003401ABD5